jgi:hypothetical protein
METAKNNKLRFKFGLPTAIAQELNTIKDMANKALKESNPNNKHKKNNNPRNKQAQSLIKQLTKIRTSTKIVPDFIKEKINYLYTLRQKYSIAFPVNSRPSLKKGIVDDIAQELNISKNSAKKFVSWYTESKEYLKSHKEGAPRYSLTGTVVGYVIKEEEEAKKLLLQKIWTTKINTLTNTLPGDKKS